jgi:hypothetical protein
LEFFGRLSGISCFFLEISSLSFGPFQAQNTQIFTFLNHQAPIKYGLFSPCSSVYTIFQSFTPSIIKCQEFVKKGHSRIEIQRGKTTGYESYKYKITNISHNHKNSHKITIIYKN